MVKNPPENTPRIAPYLLYEDLGGALDFLATAFGFRERLRIPGPEGTIAHAEMELRDGGVMMGCPGPDYQNPKRAGYTFHLVHVYVDDVDAHYAKAKEAGAKILSKPEDQFYGDRRYMAEDPEGHQWNFATHVRDVPIEEMQNPGAG